MKLNKEGLDLIKEFEGCKLHAYQDIVGVWTIGYGATGKGVAPGMTWTQEQADSRLNEDLARFTHGVEDLVEVDLNDNQFSALVSFAYNLGIGNLAKSGLLNKLNKENYVGASQSFPLWNKAGGKVVAGLTRRRMAEQALFLKAAA